jgi:hypothetical protein
MQLESSTTILSSSEVSMTPPLKHQSVPIEITEFEVVGENTTNDSILRLGRLEFQVNQILPMLGRVDEAVTNQNQVILDIKSDVKDIAGYITEIKLQTVGYGNKISDMEDKIKTYDTVRLENLEQAKEKAECIIELSKKERIDKRNNLLKLAGTAIASIVSAAVITWLRLR